MVELATYLPSLPRLFSEINMERMQELQRFAELGRVSAGLIHDISSPLTAAILHLEREDQGLHTMKHVRRSIRVLERYVEAARQQLRQEGQTTTFCVKHEMNEVRRLLKPLAQRRHIKLRFDIQKNYKLMGDPVKFQRILANLVTNAIDAYQDWLVVPAKPLVQVTVSANQQQLVIQVQDWGQGITADQLPHLFEPFYTTKHMSANSGTGLGLATVKRYVEDDFGGHIKVASSASNGTEFCIKLQLGAR